MICSPVFPSPTRFRRHDASAIPGQQVTLPPIAYPITVAQARKQIEYPSEATDHDEHLQRLIAAATLFLQNQTGRQLLRATIAFTYDQFPRGSDVLWIPRPPLATVNAITYLDTAGATQTMPTADYLVATDCQPGRVSLKRLGSGRWPLTLNQGRAVTISADCGYATADDVPEDIKLCLLWMVNEWFEERGGDADSGGWANSLLESLRIGDDFLNYAGLAGDPAYVGYPSSGALACAGYGF